MSMRPPDYPGPSRTAAGLLVEQPKSGLQSTTVWGGLLAAVPSIAALVLPLVGAPPGTLELVSQVTGVIGGAMAIYGRYNATRVVGKVK